MLRNYNFIDKLVSTFDQSLRTLTGTLPPTGRKNPAQDIPKSHLTSAETKHVIGLLRVDHAGEICAQALYQGQALVARSDKIKAKLLTAAEEENDHLIWCHQRIMELNGRVSYLNPAWYIGSFCIGLTAAALGDKWSLGFLVATEEQVSKHLQDHLQQLPTNDKRSHAILQQMYYDEQHHATQALEAGAADLPQPVKILMQAMSKVMTTTAYWV